MDNLLLAKYLNQPVVHDRNLVALLTWAALAAQTPPSAPSRAGVRLLLLAERIPSQIENYAMRTKAYFLQDERVQASIHEHLNPFNSQPVEETLAVQLGDVIGAFAARFAELEIGEPQVQAWLDAHFPA